MWDNPRQLNAAAGFLTALALIVFVVAAAQLLLRSPLFPVREILVTGLLTHTTRAQIEAATRGRVAGNFFAVDLADVRAGLESLPWVRRAEVRRVWPDQLEASLVEHVALARWDDGGLVSELGQRFGGESKAALPALAGPEGSEAELTRRYLGFIAILAPLGVRPARVVMSRRRAWMLRLDDGLTIALGRDAEHDPVEARLQRLVAAYPESIGRMTHKVEHVDLRYPNGFALRLAEPKS
jgi:cell division protein FtsQ